MKKATIHGRGAGRGRGPTLVAAMLLCIAAGCRDEPAPAAPEARGGTERASLLVLAAADLQAAMPELTARFTEQTGHEAAVMLASSGNLTTQIEHGAPADVFLAANKDFVDRLAAQGLILGGARRVYAVGPLAVVSAPGVPLPADLAELADAQYSTIAIANPEHAPYGMAAREALQAAGLWEELEERLVFSENVAQAMQLVRTGNADAGVVALGLVFSLPDAEWLAVDPALHAPLRQTAAILNASTRPDAARSFLALLLGPEGQEILRKHGFEPPEGN